MLGLENIHIYDCDLNAIPNNGRYRGPTVHILLTNDTGY